MSHVVSVLAGAVASVPLGALLGAAAGYLARAHPHRHAARPPTRKEPSGAQR